MALKNNDKDTPVAISSPAVELLRIEQDKMRNEGIRMSLGAIASKAIINQLRSV